MICFSRRATLRLGAGIAALLALPAGIRRAFARADLKEVIATFSQGRTPVEDKVDLDVPFTVDNANAVPVSVRVDSPMTTESYCEEVLLIAEKNPRPFACAFRFSPELSVPQISTRIRLAESQDIIALARMNDGSVFVARKAILVTISGCSG